MSEIIATQSDATGQLDPLTYMAVLQQEAELEAATGPTFWDLPDVSDEVSFKFFFDTFELLDDFW